MMNMTLLTEALKLVNEFYEAEGIYETDAVIMEVATKWYNHTEIVDAEMLAAVTMYGSYTPSLTWEDILAIKESFFPTAPYEVTDFHIGEIEEALFDEGWR